MINVIKRNGNVVPFEISKIKNAIQRAFDSCDYKVTQETIDDIASEVDVWEDITVEEIQDQIEEILMDYDYPSVAKAYILYRNKHAEIRTYAKKKKEFIQEYSKSSNTANATIDDNSNVANKNIGILNAEIHKEDNIQISRVMITDKLRELFPDFDSNQYIKDLTHHIIYKHDESSFAGAIAPYCCSISMYPFILNGIKGIGGLSAAPKNLDSYCGMYVNLIFATSAMFAGAIATSEFLLYFDYFARKAWGDNYYQKSDCIITSEHCLHSKTIKEQIHQHFQQVIYSINQPAAARGLQSASITKVVSLG